MLYPSMPKLLSIQAVAEMNSNGIVWDIDSAVQIISTAGTRMAKKFAAISVTSGRLTSPATNTQK